MTYDGVPNLDCMESADLWDFFWRASRLRTLAKELFPTRPPGYVNATKDLTNYACNKAVAVKLRLDGKIDQARVYESICERLYKELPSYARW